MSEMTYDYSGDNVADALEITGAPGSGFTHATGIDADQNGVYETLHVDMDGDLAAEVTFFDTDQNGVVDTGQVDESGNGRADVYVYDTNVDGVLDTKVIDANENGANDATEITPTPAAPAGMPTPAEAATMIAANPGSLIGLYEQILNTPVDPADDQAVANKAQVLALIAERVAAQQSATMRLIDGM